MGIAFPEYITGNYAVGTEHFTVTDRTREEIFGKVKEPRRLEVRLFYPVYKESIDGCERMKLSEERIEAIKDAYLLHKIPEELVSPDCFVKVPQAEGKFPLLIYNHGYGSGYTEGNLLLCCEMASNGYIVASIGHAYEAAICEFDDGTTVRSDRKEIQKMQKGGIKAFFARMKLLQLEEEPEKIYASFFELQKKHMRYYLNRLPEWGKDTLCVIEHLKQTFESRIDFAKGIGATGHSLGGAVAYWLCQYFDEITCGANMDGAVFGDYTGMIMKKPFLQIGCRQSYNFEVKPLLDTIAPVRTEFFDEMSHLGFTDAKFMYEQDSVKAKFAVGKLDALKMYRRLADCHLAFFGEYLKDKGYKNEKTK